MNYILECSLFSLLATGLYWVFRHRMTLRERRITLLGIIILSAVIPLIHIPVGYQPFEKVSINQVIDLNQPSKPLVKSTAPTAPSSGYTTGVPAAGNRVNSASQSDNQWSYREIAIWLYCSVAGGLLLHFLISLWAIARLYKKSPRVSKDGLTYREVPVDGFLGAAFFRTVFIGGSLDSSRIGIIYQHELAHSRLLHSMDILLAQIYVLFLWANPMAWILRKEIRLVTECEADQMVARQTDVRSYSHGLLDISFSRSISTLLPAFSKHAIKYRLDQLLAKKEIKWSGFGRMIPIMFLFLALVFACEVDRDSLYSGETRTPGDVKTITTTYVSHQSDTQQKDGQIVAVASFGPNGDLDYIEQHSSYPYDYTEPFKWDLWPERKTAFVPHILDGLSLGDAEKNFLYGNDWPIQYVVLDKQNSRRVFESDKVTKSIEYHDDQFPREYQMTVEEDSTKNIYGFKRKDTYFDQFEAENGKVTTHKAGFSFVYFYGDESGESGLQNFEDVEFEYDGELLTRVLKGDVDYKFHYEKERLIRSEYFSGGKLYNQRIYHYNDSGLKTKTEIFNVYGEPEYTIYYDYEFWEE